VPEERFAAVSFADPAGMVRRPFGEAGAWRMAGGVAGDVFTPAHMDHGLRSGRPIVFMQFQMAQPKEDGWKSHGQFHVLRRGKTMRVAAPRYRPFVDGVLTDCKLWL